MPFKLSWSTMVPSPTKKGVVVIGEKVLGRAKWRKLSDAIIELSGDSIETLTWTILEQRLRNPRSGHFQFLIKSQMILKRNNYADDQDHSLMPKKRKSRKT